MKTKSTQLLKAGANSPIHTGHLADLLDLYRRSQKAFDAIDDEKLESREYADYRAIQLALIGYPCTSEDEALQKIAFCLEDMAIYDSVQSESVNGRDLLKTFMLSLIR